MNRAIFGEKLLDMKCVLIFSTVFIETLLTLRRMQQGTIKLYMGIHMKYPLFLLGINETSIFSIDFRGKNWSTKFYENPSSESRVVLCGRTNGRTDGRDEGNSRFSQFCELV